MKSWYCFGHFLVVSCHWYGFRKEPKHCKKLESECVIVKTFSELEDGGAGTRWEICPLLLLCPFLLVSLWSTVKLLTVMGLCWVTWFLWQTARDMELSFSCSHEEHLVASSLPWHRDAYPALLYYWAFWLCAALRSFSSQTQIRISSNQLCPPTNRSFSLACTKAFVCKRNCNLELVFDSMVFSAPSGYKYDSPLSEEPVPSAGSDPVFNGVVPFSDTQMNGVLVMTSCTVDE